MRTMLKSSVIVVLLFAAATVCLAADNAFMGTWKLNEAKSKLGAGPKNSTVVYAADGDNVKITVDGTGADGKATHSEWTGKFDGKDYAVTGGGATQDMRAYTKVGTHSLHMVIKKDGKVTQTGTITVAASGKTRTVSIKGTDEKGKKFVSTAVYDKE